MVKNELKTYLRDPASNKILETYICDGAPLKNVLILPENVI
jgi:hypothetical protein